MPFELPQLVPLDAIFNPSKENSNFNIYFITKTFLTSLSGLNELLKKYEQHDAVEMGNCCSFNGITVNDFSVSVPRNAWFFRFNEALFSKKEQVCRV